MTTDRSDPYAVLGLTAHATQEEVRRAYLALLRQHHPDVRRPGDPTDDAVSDATLQQAIAAYLVLGDPASRARFDRRTTASTAAPRVRIRVTRPTPGRADQPPILAGPVRWHPSR
ncbi:J domain-containing protein [uncultured Phycicoccus sp.]|uniref:J domain-containing protein n=1 Tax=uncultured Phycicoccus sp. TaxID=661422 RepID=UPI00262F9574|nr:J domain-containing protein [uncultured Phycicoccus sp.]